MADQLDRVRISAAELRAEASHNPLDSGDSRQEDCHKKSWRRPDLQRYQHVPGQGRYCRDSEEAEIGTSKEPGPLTSDSQDPPVKPKNIKKNLLASGRHQCTDAGMSACESTMRSDRGKVENCKADAHFQVKTEAPRDRDLTENDREGQEPVGAAKPKKARKPDREFYRPGSRRNVHGKDCGAAQEQDKPLAGTQDHKDKPGSQRSTEEREEEGKMCLLKQTGNDKEVKSSQENVRFPKPNKRSKDVEKAPLDAAVEKLASKVDKLRVKGKAKVSGGGQGDDEAGGRRGNTAEKERREQGGINKDKEEDGEKKRENGNRRRRGGDKERNQESGRGEDGSARAERGKERERTEADRANKSGKGAEMLQNKGRENHRIRGDNNSSGRFRVQPDKDGPAQRNVERKENKSNVTMLTSKRYSKSDIRRPRNRTYSSSSASSVTSLDAPALDRIKRPYSESKPNNRERGTTSEERHRSHLHVWTTNGDSSTDSREGSETGDAVDNKSSTYRKDGPSVEGRREERNRPKGNKSRGRGILRVSLEKQAASSLHGGERPKQVSTPLGRGGGILVLPSHTNISNTPEVGQRLLFGGSRGGSASRGRRGRGGGARRLWDPNNPDQKPALTPSQSSQHQSLQQPVYLQTGTGYGQLHFLDTDDEISGGPPVHQGENFRSQQQAAAMAYYKFQNSDNPYCYPLPASNLANPSTVQRYSLPYMAPYQMANGVYPGQFCATYRNYTQAGSGFTSEEVEQQARGELGRLLRAADSQELQLSNLLSRDRLSADGLERMAQLRVELLGLYERVVLTDIELADSQNVDQALWKNVFYQVIEHFRQLLKDPASDNTPHIRNMLLTLLDEGAQFFDALLQKLQTVYQFKLDDYMDGMAIRARPLRKTVKYALISAQRCMICQGDIARYREQASDSANFGKARSWYLKAQQIAPKNGRPYNQLALLAVYTKRKLDAVYYYMRSLAASNPILTAKESLMSLFEEAKRKTEQLERRRRQEDQGGSRGPAVRGRARGEDGARSEIWFRPSGHTVKASCQRGGSESSRDSEQDGELSSLSPSDLNKRFILSFLHAHGKLFTKVGMESFPRVARRVLQEFTALLNHGPSLLGSTHMLQIITINMFTIQNALSRGEEGETRSLLQEQSTALGLAMFALMVQRCTELLVEVPSAATAMLDGEQEEKEDELDGLVRVSDFSLDLRELLPSIKVWSDWMLGHPDQWNPPPCGVNCSPDVWQCLANLCNVLARVDHEEVPLYKVDTDEVEGDEELTVLQLKEDRLLAGFVPLLAAPQEPCYIDQHTDTAIASDCKRVTVLKYFLEALCGQEEPLLAFKGGKYISIAPPPSSTSVDVKTRQDSMSEKEADDVIVEAESSLSASEGEEDEEEAGDSESDIRQLKARRHALANKLAEEQKRKDKIQAVLQTSGQLQLEVRPLFLVPDTNGFIDHLAALKKLLHCGTYIIVVPLIVITELDGLAKGQDTFGGGLGHGAGSRNSNVSAVHMRAVQEKAHLAVAFLEHGFEAREPRLRALTSRGNQLESIAFRSEDTSGQQGNNDDVILSCCLHYCKDKAKDFMPDQRNGTVRLQREVVLLTDDRNLRVKALTRNVPVRDIPAFLSWAKVG